MQFNILRESENNFLQIESNTEENVILCPNIEMFQKSLSSMVKSSCILQKEILFGMKKKKTHQNQNPLQKKKKKGLRKKKKSKSFTHITSTAFQHVVSHSEHNLNQFLMTQICFQENIFPFLVFPM
jgi:hypothetical protein